MKHRDTAKIAKALSVTERTIYPIVKSDEFHTCLDTLGYTGQCNLRKAQRGMSQKHDKARIFWERRQQDDTPKHKQARIISEQFLTNIQTIRGWIRDWRAE